MSLDIGLVEVPAHPVRWAFARHFSSCYAHGPTGESSFCHKGKKAIADEPSMEAEKAKRFSIPNQVIPSRRRQVAILTAPLSSSILDLAIFCGETSPVPILFEFKLGMSLDWKEWVDRELPDIGFMKCIATYTLFLSCGEITVTLKDVANQLMLPVLGDIDPFAIQFSIEEEAVEHILWERCARHLAKCKPVRYAKEKFQSYPKEWAFSWRACKDFSTGYTCVDSVIRPFMGTTSTTTPLVAYDERGITYLVATNSGWLPYLVDKGIQYVHYSAYRVRRQFGLDQDMPDDFTLRVGLCIAPMHAYWQAIMTSFSKDLLGS
ncbi:hypothetical protein SO802_009884 [Lithocarpus litseifolius]|uniref:Uncharacterized protein n=1 Tax=Lithocarpus litseifolius TaxID=425828 RepID=A0AAW2DD78_9ROSI